MAQIWSEPIDCTKHRNHMAGVPPSAEDYNRAPTLLQRRAYFVRVCSFTFEFRALQQIEVCLDYYDRKIQLSSRMDTGAADHWECQRWFERLPLYLRKESKRQKVVKALRFALQKFSPET